MWLVSSYHLRCGGGVHLVRVVCSPYLKLWFTVSRVTRILRDVRVCVCVRVRACAPVCRQPGGTSPAQSRIVRRRLSPDCSPRRCKRINMWKSVRDSLAVGFVTSRCMASKTPSPACVVSCVSNRSTQGIAGPLTDSPWGSVITLRTEVVSSFTSGLNLVTWTSAESRG